MKYKGLFQGISYIVIGISNALLFLGVMVYEKNASLAFIGFAVILLVAAIVIMTLKKTVSKTLGYRRK